MEAAKHENIELVTNTELVDVTGEAGAFKARLRHKPWYVDTDRCTGCGACVDACPITVPHEWEMNLKPRKAIYALFPQAAPLKYVIDRDRCIECGLCMQACGLDAINLTQDPWEEEVDAGAIVVATGCQVFDPSDLKQFRYGELENVVTNMEFERICNAAGPTEGELVRPDGKHIKKVGLVQCVGSRDLANNPWCSFFCCMASVKGGRLVMEHSEGAEVTVFYNDMRACGKGFEELYKRSIEEGMHFVRAIPSVHANHSTNNPVVVYEDTDAGRMVTDEMDLVVLACGLEPSRGTERVAEILNIGTDDYGFIAERHPTDGMAETSRPGVYVAGVSQGPKDIPDAATQGSAAASRVGIFLSGGQPAAGGSVLDLRSGPQVKPEFPGEES